MIRKMKLSDVEAVVEIDKSLALSNWTDTLYRQELIDDCTLAYVDEESETIRGFIVVRLIGETSDLMQIAVREDFKSQGLGRALLQHCWDEVISRGTNEMLLEVREKHIDVVKFYEQFGFKTIYKRKNYYGMRKDALVMRLRVDENVDSSH